MAASHVATLGSGQNWTSQVTQSIVASASAHGASRRSPEKAAEELRRAEELHKRTQQLQQNEAMQQRMRNIQNMVAAQQKRLQLLQQIEEAQKKIQQAQQQTEAMQKRLQVMRAHTPHGLIGSQHRVQAQQQQTQEILKRVQEMRAHHHGRQQQSVGNVLTAPRLPPAMRHQIVLQQVMSRLRHQHHAGVGHTAPGQLAIMRAGSIGHHHSVLLATMARIRSPHPHGLLQGGHHRFQPLQNALYHRMLHKLSHHHRRDRETKQPETVARAPETTSSKKATTSGVSMDGLGNTAAAGPNNTKLPEVPVVVADASGRAGDGMLKLGGPQQPKSDDDGGGSAKAKRGDPGKKDDAGPDPDPKNPKPTGRGLGAQAPLGFGQDLKAHVPNEVLAFNLGANGLARAKELKFQIVEDADLGALRYRITRLKVPDQFDAISAMGTLFKEVPAEGYSLNRVYVPYRTMSEASPSGAGTSAPPPVKPALAKPIPGGAATGCSPERCFAPALIKWQPQLSACARDMKIGVIDTDFDRSHPAFAGANIIGAGDSARDNILPPGSTKAPNLHGTAVLSLLRGNAASSTPGLVPEATIYYRNAFFADPNGNAMSSTMTMLRALNWMKEQKVDILNLSFAGPKDQAVEDAIRELAKGGTVVLAAAGNDGPTAAPTFPAAYPEVIAVTAVDRNLAVYAYANRGNHIAVAAPGVDVWTAIPNKREGAQTGTSFAVPFATSIVALSYPPADQRSNGDPLAPRQRALELLQKSIKPIGGGGNRQVFGAGLVQAPSHCDPHTPPAAVAAVTPPTGGGWAGKVEVAPVAPAHSWAITVQSVVDKK